MYGQSGLREVQTLEHLDAVVSGEISEFQMCGAFNLLDNHRFSKRHYAAIVRSIFHQTYNAPLTFALAGANCLSKHASIRDYLLVHAVEEKDHWQWARHDLAALGVDIEGIEEEAATPSVSAFIAFNFYLATRVPFSRMGTAYFLESLSAEVGPSAARKMAAQANLTSTQMTFFLGHAESDQGHKADLRRVLAESKLCPDEVGLLAWAAKTSSSLYRSMYEEAVAFCD